MGDRENIIMQVETYIRRGGGVYGDWFVGLADNPIMPIREITRLGRVQNQKFTYIETVSNEVAKSAADYFISVCKTDGDISHTKKDAACRALYLYKKNERPVASRISISEKLFCRLRDKMLQVCAADNKK